MQIRFALSLFALAAFALTASKAHAVPFDLNFANPGPDCPTIQPVCSNVDVLPAGAPDLGVIPPTGFPFLSYNVGGNTVTAAAWIAFDGDFIGPGDGGVFEFGQMIQDIDNPGGGLAVNDGPSDNIDAGESVAFFANGGTSSFVVSDILLGNHPGADLNPDTLFELWWTDNVDVFAPWQSMLVAIGDAGSEAAALGTIFGIAFESINDDDGTFYLSAAAGEITDVVPEPTTALLLGLGLAGLAARRREV